MRAAILVVLLLGCVSASAAGTAPSLRLAGFDSRGRPLLSQQNPSNQVARLEYSPDLLHWAELARLHGTFDRFPDTLPAATARFYRALNAPRTAADDWKNHALYPVDPLLSPAPAWDQFEPRWLKFAIDLAEPHRVYFQDSARYAFHYDFAVQRLERFKGLTREAFDAVSLHRAGQQVLLGAALYAPTDNLPEIALQFVGYDPYPREEIADWFDLVRSVIQLQVPADFYYFPTYEQQAVALANTAYFAQRGIAVSSAMRWVTADECYAPGWTLGRLVFVTASEIPAAYASGRLGPDDILLVDVVPAEVPPVAGIISLSPATPNSHVAILAQSFGIPFVYFSAVHDRKRLLGWDQQEIVLRAAEWFGACNLRAVNVEAQLTREERAQLLALKAPPKLNFTPKRHAGQFSLPADTLRPADIGLVGGKAANFGLLRRAIPANSPSPALALTFDLWDAYLDQVLPGGLTLRARVEAELRDLTWPPDMAETRTRLSRIREWFTDTADFSPTLRAAVLEALARAGFHPGRNLRFRSSTNVEDSEQFSGAGLYDSYSGCLLDDTDNDEAGPSACDPTEARERGVFRALRKVFASFYNDNAFLERLRHGVDETTVGMAALVHHSTPDEFELANGVATAAVTRGSQPEERWVDLRLVSQPGAAPVTNPDPNGLPEDVRVSLWSNNEPWLTFVRQSSLVPLGATVLAWESEYRTLVKLLDAAARAYHAEFPRKTEISLDFEYKKVAPTGALRVKQIREVPRPDPGNARPEWLVNETNRWAVLQGEHGNVFANHRLKSFWSLQTATLRIANSNLAQTLYRHVKADLLEGHRLRSYAGEISTFPEHRYTRQDLETLDQWSWGDSGSGRRFELRTTLPAETFGSTGPIAFLSDGTVTLDVTYPTPQPVIDWNGVGTTLKDSVRLRPVTPVTPRSLRQQRRLSGAGIAIETTFYWPPNPTGPVAGYTAPVQAWVETIVTGLASRPIVLHGDFSQTYMPGHHNFWEEFIFDPHLEAGVAPDLLAELTAKNIRAVVGSVTFDETQALWIWGLDDKLRKP